MDLFRADRFVTRMMADAGVIILRGMLVAFDVTFDPDDRATWATPGNVRRALVERGLASPRRVDDMLARFRQAGYVEAVPAPGDRRTRLVRPTGPLIAHDRAHLAAYHRFLLHLVPGRGYEWVLTGDETVHRAVRRAAFRDLARATSALDHGAMRLFLAHDAGYLALLLVAQGQLAQGQSAPGQSSGADGPTWTSLSDDLGVARSHLRTLFGRAEAEGYVRLGAGARRPVEILPPLWGAYDRFLADVQADQDAIARAAFAEVARAERHRSAPEGPARPSTQE